MNDNKKCNKIYGVDISKTICGLDVRDAIIRCFSKAHNNALDNEREGMDNLSKEEKESTKKIEVIALIKKVFSGVDGNFDDPTKNDLKKVISALKDYSKDFRDKKIIKKHYLEIEKLIDNIRESENC
ncbi:hypothetical protein GOV14_06070 [Candidatus Pacearchaeota archaeon]|nr:hypothetical protein [Candidatus Pacearchaeota archaeon]